MSTLFDTGPETPAEAPEAASRAGKPKRPPPDMSWGHMPRDGNPQRWAALTDLEGLDPSDSQERAAEVVASAARCLSGKEFAEVLDLLKRKLSEGLVTGRFKPGEEIPE